MMACRFEYNGKSYTQDELAKELENMPPSIAHKFIPGVSNVPDAPFKNNWPDLAIKHIIRKAVEEGKDAISWTPGEAQAARYDLSKQVDTLQAIRNVDGTYQLHARPLNDAGFTELGKSIPKEKLADNIGKELAEKIINQKEDVKSYKGIDLKVGGEGMKAFYDKMLPAKVNALVKKYGGKVEHGRTKTELNFAEKNALEYWNGLSEKEKAAVQPDVREGYEKLGTQPIHVLRLTPELKKAAMEEGFPLFSSSPTLIPVDNDPFKDKKKKNVKLVPVQGNPFEAK